MDNARRWQVASLTTAVASLGVGAALLARPSIDVVPSIDLDQVTATAALRPELRSPADPDDLGGPAIIVPRGIVDTTAVTASPASADDDAAEHDDTDAPGEVDEPPVATTPDPPAEPASPAPQPSPASIDSVDDDLSSVDSPSSVGSAD